MPYNAAPRASCRRVHAPGGGVFGSQEDGLVVKSCKLTVGVISMLWAMVAVAERVPPGTADEIAERLQPFGELCRSGEACAQAVAGGGADAGGARSGEAVFNQFCATCHGANVAEAIGAPAYGDTAAWQPRLAQGMDTLWQHTLEGLNAMPARGTCMNCTEEELRAALDYIIEPVQ